MFPCQYSHANASLSTFSFYLISSIVCTASLPLMIIDQIFNSLFLFFVLLCHPHFPKTQPSVSKVLLIEVKFIFSIRHLLIITYFEIYTPPYNNLTTPCWINGSNIFNCRPIRKVDTTKKPDAQSNSSSPEQAWTSHSTPTSSFSWRIRIHLDSINSIPMKYGTSMMENHSRFIASTQMERTRQSV